MNLLCKITRTIVPCLLMILIAGPVRAEVPEADSSVAPGAKENFDEIMARKKEEKSANMKRQMDLLHQRYDLSERPAKDATMSGGKPVQEGVRVKLPQGTTWEKLGSLSPEEIKDKNLFPAGFYPLPHASRREGGTLFPKFQIDEIKKQEGRDLTRFDVDFDIPDHFLPEFPSPIYLTSRPELGDVSKGRVVTIDNYFELFKGILTSKQMEGLQFLLTPFTLKQFNPTSDRRSEHPSRGVTCFDCHSNGNSNGALIGPFSRIETPTLRGVNVQQIYGSQRAAKTLEDFTEDENKEHVHSMALFQVLLDFPPAPKLGIDGKLIPKKATESELRGQTVFFGKGQCSSCHAPPYYTDNSMHNLQAERFYKLSTINGVRASADGPIKTFPLRGIKDTPPYMHDGRLLTLEDTVEFFNLILGTQLTAGEKSDLVTFLRAL